jgi:hypothetical protein
LKGEIMLRKLILTVMAFFFVFSVVGTALALEKGNKRKGKYTYRKVYKACFERGAVDSKTPSISPADKTQAEWDAVFTKKRFDTVRLPGRMDQPERNRSHRHLHLFIRACL